MLLLEIREVLDRDLAALLAEPVGLCRDALILRLANGVTAELRFASAAEYSIGWRWGDAELRVDTAPPHPELATFPNHLHDHEGRVAADPLTVPGRAPLDNLRRLFAAIGEDPLLQRLPDGPAEWGSEGD